MLLLAHVPLADRQGEHARRRVEQPPHTSGQLRGSSCEDVVDHLCLVALRFRSDQRGLEIPVQLAGASLGVLLASYWASSSVKSQALSRVARRRQVTALGIDQGSTKTAIAGRVHPLAWGPGWSLPGLCLLHQVDSSIGGHPHTIDLHLE